MQILHIRGGGTPAGARAAKEFRDAGTLPCDPAAMLRDSIVSDGAPAYELVATGALRPLDPVEHNMERLNALARGSSTVYIVLRVRGPLSAAGLRRALDDLTSRHPVLRLRIARDTAGALVFVPTHGAREDGAASIPLFLGTLPDAGAWPAWVEADMNLGATDSARGPLCALALLELPQQSAAAEHLLVLAAHHSVADGLSCIALLHELLQQVAAPAPPTRLTLQAVHDPFDLPLEVPEMPGLDAEVAAACASATRTDSAQLSALLQRLEALEERLLAAATPDGRFPAALKSLHAHIERVTAAASAAAGALPEADAGEPALRYARVRTCLLHRRLERSHSEALLGLIRARGVSLHGALSAAFFRALAERNAELAARAGEPTSEWLTLATPVNLRAQFVPPLAPNDLRMAVDVALTHQRVSPSDSYWELAARAGSAVTRAVQRRRPLSSWFRTPRRDLTLVPPGNALPLLSNLGKLGLATEYGNLRVLEASGSMAAHGSFRLGALFTLFDGELTANFYCETPSVSRASLERVADGVFETLQQAARGEEPGS